MFASRYGTRIVFAKQLKGKNFKRIFRELSTKSSKPEPLSFEGQTAIVTGAGRGLGREYALLLASRGANVVVNDFGGSRSGEPLKTGDAGKEPADLVVEDIKRLNGGGEAIGNYDSISSESGAKSLIAAAMERFGRIDILVNNAGILRDKSFAKMSVDDWDQVHNVHLRGSFLVTHACWPIMIKQAYGKIIMTSSTSGLYGNFGQANYSAAKMGLIGLANTLAIEGERSNICCNTVVPMAASRLTEDIIPADFGARLKAAYVAPLVGWLCHRDCSTTGAIVEASGRWFGRYGLQRARGKYLSKLSGSPATDNSLEELAGEWSHICDLSQGATQVESFRDHLSELMRLFELNAEKEN